MSTSFSEKHTYSRLLGFTLPTILTLIFTSIYNVVDGLFVSNYVGKDAFTAVNFIFPCLLCLSAVGFMLGTGGSALVAKTMGEQDDDKANKIFSLIIYTAIVIGIVISILGFVFLRQIAILLGASGELLKNSLSYARIVILSLPALILQFSFQSLYSTAGKPKLNLYFSIIAGLSNIILDAIFVAGFAWGLEGAASATVISQYIGGILPLLYFTFPNTSLLHLGKTSLNFASLLKVCGNGSSELLSQISMSFVSMLYNKQLLKYAGADGVASYGVLMYLAFIFVAIFIGYSVGTSPIISYQYGAKNTEELKNVLQKSLVILGCFALVMLFTSFILARPLAMLFVGYDESLFNMTVHAFKIFSFVFIFAGFSIFCSAFFTVLNNGLVSAIISFLRTVIFQLITVLIFPLFWGLDGIWFSIVGADIMAFIIVVFFMFYEKKRYGY